MLITYYMIKWSASEFKKERSA